MLTKLLFHQGVAVALVKNCQRTRLAMHAWAALLAAVRLISIGLNIDMGPEHF